MNSRLDPQIAAELYARRYNIRLYGVYFVFGFRMADVCGSYGRSVMIQIYL